MAEAGLNVSFLNTHPTFSFSSICHPLLGLLGELHKQRQILIIGNQNRHRKRNSGGEDIFYRRLVTKLITGQKWLLSMFNYCVKCTYIMHISQVTWLKSILFPQLLIKPIVSAIKLIWKHIEDRDTIFQVFIFPWPSTKLGYTELFNYCFLCSWL